MSSTFQYDISPCSNLIMNKVILITVCICFHYCLALPFLPPSRVKTTTIPGTVKQKFEWKLKQTDKKMVMAVTENGCPFVFDFGQLGDTWYMPHDICFNRRFPPYLNPKAQHPPASGEVSIVLDQFPGMTDTYKVTVAVNNPKTTKFRIWDLVLWNEEVKEENPGLAGFMLQAGSQSKSAGYFEVKDNFMPICCDFVGGTQIRDTIRFINTQNKRLVDTFVRYVPLNYTGKVRFHANVISTKMDYIVNAKSEIYTVPFSTPNVEDLPYDEDWPEDSPNIPEY